MLPLHKVDVVGKFIDFILCKANNEMITRHLMKLLEQSSAFKFLNHEPDLNSAKNLLEKIPISKGGIVSVSFRFTDLLDFISMILE